MQSRRARVASLQQACKACTLLRTNAGQPCALCGGTEFAYVSSTRGPGAPPLEVLRDEDRPHSLRDANVPGSRETVGTVTVRAARLRTPPGSPERLRKSGTPGKPSTKARRSALATLDTDSPMAKNLPAPRPDSARGSTAEARVRRMEESSADEDDDEAKDGSSSESSDDSSSRSSSGDEDPRAPPAGSALAAVRARADGASESKNEPPEALTYVSAWSAADRLDSKPHGDATEESDVAVRIFDVESRLQAGCAPVVKPNQEYYDFEGPKQLTRLQAGQQSAGVAVQQTQPLIYMPPFGGARRVAIGGEVSTGAVGVHEGLSTASAAGKVVLERKRRQGAAAGGGERPTFTTWMKGEDKSTAGVQYTTTAQSTVLAMKARAPGGYMNTELLKLILAPTRANKKKWPHQAKRHETTKWCAKWDSD